MNISDENSNDDAMPVNEVEDENQGDGEGGATPEAQEGGCRRIGPYEILETLGDGGMGIVYKVRHCGAGTMLAMKVLRSELALDPVNVKRFRQEMKTSSLVNHANVVATYDSGFTDDGAPYLVMEFVDGYNVQQILEQEGYLDLDRFFHIFGQVCDALAHAHSKRIIHRDLKPSNIMIAVTDTGFELAKLVDFGIARVFQRPTANATGRLTQMGDVLGSPIYMSPEQCLSQKLDERSDIYSLGVVMYEALVGAPPFASENAVEVIMGHLQQKPPSLAKMRPDFNLPPDLEMLIYACLEKEPAVRIQTVADVATELKKISLSARSSSFVRMIKQFPHRLTGSLKRSLRKLNKARHQLVKPAVAAVVAGGLFYWSYQTFLAPHYTVNDYIGQAELAIMNQDYDQASVNWDKAIKLAVSQGVARDKLAQLYERAADDMASSIQKNIQLSSNLGWNAVMPREYNQNMPQLQSRAAKPFLDQALVLYNQLHMHPEWMRVLDKVIGVCQQLDDVRSEEALLRQRIAVAEGPGGKGTSANSGAYRRLSELLLNRGREAEAEATLMKEVQVERLQNSRPYPNSLTELARLYHRTGRYSDEIKVIKEMVVSLREESVENPRSYDDQLMRELLALASAERRQGMNAEADAALEEAKHLKAKIQHDAFQ